MKGVTLFAAIMFSISAVDRWVAVAQLIINNSNWTYWVSAALLALPLTAGAIFFWTLFSKQQKIKK